MRGRVARNAFAFGSAGLLVLALGACATVDSTPDAPAINPGERARAGQQHDGRARGQLQVVAQQQPAGGAEQRDQRGHAGQAPHLARPEARRRSATARKARAPLTRNSSGWLSEVPR